MRDIMDLHTHTVASGHAYNTLYEMAHAASEQKLTLFGSTDHGPRMGGAPHELYFINFKVIPNELYGVRLLMGCELNILDYEGHVDLVPYHLKKMDYAIASIHVPCFTAGTVAQNTSAIVGAMKNPYVKIIGHPDDSRFPIDPDTVAAAAKEHHVLLEINNSSLNPRASRKGARENYAALLERCVHYGTPVIMGSDAHVAADVGNHAGCIALLEELHFPEELVINTSVEKLIPYIPALTLNGPHEAGF